MLGMLLTHVLFLCACTLLVVSSLETDVSLTIPGVSLLIVCTQ